MILKMHLIINPAGNYMLKVNNRNTKTRCEVCSKLEIKTPEKYFKNIVYFYKKAPS